MSSDTRIAVHGLSKQYGRVVAVNNVTFSAEPGRVTGLLGLNGAGKSTVLRMLLGLVRPGSGRSTFGEVTYQEMPDPAKQVGAVFAAGQGCPPGTGRDYVRMISRAIGVPESRGSELLEYVGLAEDAHRHISGYSLGMRQRLGIAVALLGNPKYLVLDEPGNGLDPSGILWMRSLLRDFADQGNVVLVSSHQLSEMERMADDLVILDRGSVVSSGPMLHILGAAREPHVRVRGARLDELLSSLPEGHGTLGADGALRIFGATPALVGKVAMEAGIGLEELATVAPDLEDAFHAILRSES
ncbi:ABC transporter ATP-binding protein [Streptomyces sp. NPDC057705]|uniref:ABC transporter ATP-binding protein n=1 Tax=Streptomyces sp. NPDC057705 TaxID=3346222 RepID=UPI0036B10459